MVSYHVNILALAEDERASLLQAAVANELGELGLHDSVEITFTGAPTTGAPSVAVFFGGETAAADEDLVARADEAVNEVTTVLPVVDDLGRYTSLVPDSLRPINGLAWNGTTAATTVARRVLEELGIEERQRKVFISHRRADGLLAAEQLFEVLSKRGFIPFIDRFNIPGGADVQARIADELEDYAFLLVLETPSAHESSWVYDEIDYALTHVMGLHIVRWPGEFPAVPATARLPRQVLASDDISSDGDFDQLTADAIDAVVAEIEAAHAYAMVRRRRNLLRSVEDAAEAAGCRCWPLGHGRLMVQRTEGLSSRTGREPTSRSGGSPCP